MKRLITFIFALTLAIAANAQLPHSYHSTTVHTPSGTYTVSSTTFGSHTDVRIFENVASYHMFEVRDTLGNRYVTGLSDFDLHYKTSGVETPQAGSHYIVFEKSYDSRHREVWTKLGELNIKSMPNKRCNVLGKMDFTVCGDGDICSSNVYIVYDEYLEYFTDKYINKMSDRKLRNKYGDNLATFEINSYERLTVMRK